MNLNSIALNEALAIINRGLKKQHDDKIRAEREKNHQCYRCGTDQLIRQRKMRYGWICFDCDDDLRS